MLNVIWLSLLVGSVLIALFTGNIREVVASVPESAEQAFKLALGFTGMMALWLGIMRIADESGLVQLFTRAIAPVLRYLFPGVPRNHPAMGSMAANMVANMLGLNNAATPLGIKAMQDLDSLNEKKGTATDAMCMFLAINTSSLQIVPASAIALLAAGGAANPTAIVFPAILATTVSTIVGITAAKVFAALKSYRNDREGGATDA